MSSNFSKIGINSADSKSVPNSLDRFWPLSDLTFLNNRIKPFVSYTLQMMNDSLRSSIFNF